MHMIRHSLDAGCLVLPRDTAPPACADVVVVGAGPLGFSGMQRIVEGLVRQTCSTVSTWHCLRGAEQAAKASKGQP